VLRQILALQEDQSAMLAALAARESDLAAAAKTITEQADRIGTATEWVNDIKAAISEILASTGKQIEGLESTQNTHDAGLAQLNILKDRLDKVVQALDATAKGLDERSSELGAVKQELAEYYEAWTAESKTSRREMKALSERRDAGDHMVSRLEEVIGPGTDRMEESIGASSTAQRDAAVKTTLNVMKLTNTATSFLTDFDTATAKALKEARREQTRTRRWMAPAMAIALALAAPSFVVGGALGQSEFGIFEPYDDTRGWKDGVWIRYGQQIKDCALNSRRTGQVIRCSFDVVYP